MSSKGNERHSNKFYGVSAPQKLSLRSLNKWYGVFAPQYYKFSHPLSKLTCHFGQWSLAVPVSACARSSYTNQKRWLSCLASIGIDGQGGIWTQSKSQKPQVPCSLHSSSSTRRLQCSQHHSAGQQRSKQQHSTRLSLSSAALASLVSRPSSSSVPKGSSPFQQRQKASQANSARHTTPAQRCSCPQTTTWLPARTPHTHKRLRKSSAKKSSPKGKKR